MKKTQLTNYKPTLPEGLTNIAPENRPNTQKGSRILFQLQPSIFSGANLLRSVQGRVYNDTIFGTPKVTFHRRLGILTMPRGKAALPKMKRVPSPWLPWSQSRLRRPFQKLGWLVQDGAQKPVVGISWRIIP